jgi:SAM-dependent methyltransferase
VTMSSDLNNEHFGKLQLKLKIVREFDFYLDQESVILDFGCGSGATVQEFRENGYQSFGCDIKFKTDNKVDLESMQKGGLIRLTDLTPYKLPFQDNTFDFIFSDDVFEHVRNYRETISELARILKPDGLCLHTFASRYRPVESHVYIPFSSVIRANWWLYLWVFLGIHDHKQNSESLKERVNRIYTYLKVNTNYLSKKELQYFFEESFEEVVFCERSFLKFSGRGKYILWFSKLMPLMPSLYSTFRLRTVINRKPKKDIGENHMPKPGIYENHVLK